jgi:hypothetical protein
VADLGRTELQEGQFDAALCLGATSVYGGLRKTLAEQARHVRTGGFVAVGEIFLRGRGAGLNAEVLATYRPLPETVNIFTTCGFQLHAMHSASHAEWEHYYSTIWTNIERYAVDHPQDRHTPYYLQRIRRMRQDYFEWERDALGWALFVARKE